MFGPTDLVLDAVLLGFELIEGQRVSEVGVFDLFASLFELLDAAAQPRHLGLAVCVFLAEGVHHGVAERLQPVVGQLHALPVLADGLFDGGHGHVALRAVVLVLLPAQAVEVVVLGAVAVDGCGDAEASAAAGTVDVAFEVMGSLFGAIFVEVACGEDRLHGLEGVLVNQGLVFALVFDAVVGDDAEVVALAQQLVHGLRQERALRQVLGSGQAQPVVVGLLSDIADGVEPGGVGAKGLGDQRCHDRIDHHQADVFAGPPVADVAVAERGFAGRAADLDFFT